MVIVKSDVLNSKLPANILVAIMPSPTPQNKVKDVVFAVNFSGASDWFDKTKIKGSMIFDINVDGLDSSGLAPEKFSIGLEARLLEQFLYLKLRNLPESPLLQTDTLNDTWVKIDVKSTNDTYLKQLPTNEFQNLTPDQAKKLQEAFLKAKLFDVLSSSTEKIEDVEAYHYSLAVNKQGVKDFIVDISVVFPDNTQKDSLNTLDKDLASIDFPNIEIWVGKTDGLPYKFAITSTIKSGDDSKSASEFTALLLLKNFNKSITVETPSSVKSLEEILGNLFGSFANELNSPPKK